MSTFIRGVAAVTSLILGMIGIADAVTAPAAGSPVCMALDEARKAYPREHLYWHSPRNCWDNSGQRRSTPAAKIDEPGDAPAPAAAEADAPAPAKADAPPATVTVPPVPFIAGDPTASPFWPDDKMTGRAPVDDPLPEEAQPEAAEYVVIGAPDAAPGSPDYLLDHCCWPALPRAPRDSVAVSGMIIAATTASAMAVGLWLFFYRRRRRRPARVRWA
jgi:hypothetical protein